MKKLILTSMIIASVVGLLLFSQPSLANFIEAGKSISTEQAIHITTIKTPGSQLLTIHITGSFGRGTGSSCLYSKTLDGGTFTAFDGEEFGINGGPLSRLLGPNYTCGKVDIEAPSLHKTIPDIFSLIWDEGQQQYADTVPNSSVIDFGSNQ